MGVMSWLLLTASVLFHVLKFGSAPVIPCRQKSGNKPELVYAKEGGDVNFTVPIRGLSFLRFGSPSKENTYQLKDLCIRVGYHNFTVEVTNLTVNYSSYCKRLTFYNMDHFHCARFKLENITIGDNNTKFRIVYGEQTRYKIEIIDFEVIVSGEPSTAKKPTTKPTNATTRKPYANPPTANATTVTIKPSATIPVGIIFLVVFFIFVVICLANFEKIRERIQRIRHRRKNKVADYEEGENQQQQPLQQHVEEDIVEEQQQQHQPLQQHVEEDVVEELQQHQPLQQHLVEEEQRLLQQHVEEDVQDHANVINDDEEYRDNELTQEQENVNAYHSYEDPIKLIKTSEKEQEDQVSGPTHPLLSEWSRTPSALDDAATL